ncbi:mRNA cap guanine-N7 methyltransferase 1 [Platanthera guangdongensis]|uniref:mRNA cap guanine-N7 methyltransferase 1 n=1 Tax=Platanthera guangdongensis TaxID=2320717 RepID=A0ABR2MRX1_9ASPA
MRTTVSRLIQSQSLLSRLSSNGLLRNRRLLSTDSNKIEEPFKVEEAETIKPELPGPEKVLVLGGNGYVGSHVCKEAVHQGFSVSSFSRSGRSSIQECWADNVVWNQGSLLVPDSLKDSMNDVSAVISCVGGFGSNSQMYKINGTANVNAIRAAAEQGVKRFVYISAADFGFVNYLLQGYYDGKRAAEAELLSNFPYGGESSSFDDESTRKARKVADHYSARSNQTLEEREASPIIHLKKLNNWIKSVLIQRYAHKGDAVLDLACGKGGDLIKWDKAQIGYYVGVDIAEGSIRDCRTRYNGDADQQQRRKKFSFPARLICADCYG